MPIWWLYITSDLTDLKGGGGCELCVQKFTATFATLQVSGGVCVRYVTLSSCTMRVLIPQVVPSDCYLAGLIHIPTKLVIAILHGGL